MRSIYAVVLVGWACVSVWAGISGCNIINPAEPVPTYVHIDSIGFTGADSMGGSSHRITNVYAYFDDIPVGIFDLPVTFPVIASQAGRLTLTPGIDFDGLTGYETINPMYTSDTPTLTPNPGQTINLKPHVTYNSGVRPILVERFDEGTASPLYFKTLSGDTSMLITHSSTDVLEGVGSGLVRLIPGKDSVTFISIPFGLTGGTNSYIELDYKGNLPLYVGMSAQLNAGGSYLEYQIALKPQANWRKIYIGIRDFVTANPGYNYQVLLQTVKPSDTPDGTLFLDNVKVVSF